MTKREPVKNCVCGGKGVIKVSNGVHTVMCNKCYKAAVRATEKSAIEQWNEETADREYVIDTVSMKQENLRELILDKLREIHTKARTSSANIDECLFTLGLCYAHFIKEDEDAKRFVCSTICNTD